MQTKLAVDPPVVGVSPLPFAYHLQYTRATSNRFILNKALTFRLDHQRLCILHRDTSLESADEFSQRTLVSINLTGESQLLHCSSIANWMAFEDDELTVPPSELVRRVRLVGKCINLFHSRMCFSLSHI